MRREARIVARTTAVWLPLACLVHGAISRRTTTDRLLLNLQLNFYLLKVVQTGEGVVVKFELGHLPIQCAQLRESLQRRLEVVIVQIAEQGAAVEHLREQAEVDPKEVLIAIEDDVT